MRDTTRAHRRIAQTELRGQRRQLSLGTLFLPEGSKVGKAVPLFVHFHGAAWLAEWSAHQTERNAAVLTVQLGAGSGVYRQAFTDDARFAQLLEEAARAISADKPPKFHPVVISGFSAGYGAVREIVRRQANWPLVDAVVLADGFHTSYVPEGAPGPLDAEGVKPFIDFAREAVAGRKRFIITHSEIFPGTFASTTECTDYLLKELGVTRRPVLRWGPGGMQQLSEARSGRLLVSGFAGNTAQDHVDHFHGLGEWLRRARR